MLELKAKISEKTFLLLLTAKYVNLHVPTTASIRPAAGDRLVIRWKQ